MGRMFVLVDEAPPSKKINITTIIQIINQRNNGNLEFVHEDSQLKEKNFQSWKEYLVEGHNHGMQYFEDMKTRSNKLQSSINKTYTPLSELSELNPVEFLNELVSYKTEEVRTIGQFKEHIQAMVGRRSRLTLYDRYLLKFNTKIILDYLIGQKFPDKNGAQSCDTSLFLLLKPLSVSPPKEITIYSEFFQRREYERSKRKNDPKWKDLVGGKEYQKLIRKLMEDLCDRICDSFPSFTTTKITLVDCSRNIHSLEALPHDRYLRVNRLFFVSSGGFNFSIPNWSASDYQNFSKDSSKESDTEPIRPPTHMIRLRHIDEPKRPSTEEITYCRAQS